MTQTAPNTTTALRTDDVHKRYTLGKGTAVDALRGVSLEVQSGELVALTGPSGSGKSTLLHVLGLLDHVTSGRIELAGRDVTSLGGRAAAAMRARHLGFVFQQFNLLPELTALENVMLPAQYAGRRRGEALERASELLDMVGLADRRAHRPVELSGGQQQRVALARALVNTPDLVLADEPTGDLDSGTSAEVMGMIRNLVAEQGYTFIVVTHDAAVADRCDRSLAMLDGRIVTE